MPPKTAPPVPGLNATEAEIKLAFAILKLMPRPGTSAVYAKIATDLGAPTAESVRHAIRKATEKHDWFSVPTEELAGPASTPRPKKVATPRKKKLAEAVEEAGDGAAAAAEQEEAGTPTKKRARKAKAKGKAAAAADEVPEEEGDKDEADMGGASQEPAAAAVASSSSSADVPEE